MPANPPIPDTVSRYATPGSTLRSLSRQLETEKSTPGFSFLNNSNRLPTPLLTAKPPDAENALLKQQLSQLQGDFKYNLKLLQDRDAELSTLEGQLASLRAENTSQTSALAEAQRQLAERDARIQSLLTAQESKAREEAAVLSRLRSLEEEREERERSLTGVVSRFEGALSSLAALEQRYEALAGSEARGAERAQAAETSLENARKESAALRDRVERLESEARRSEDARSLAEAEADRCRASGASAQALLEAARTSLESCRRDAQQWAAERARLSAAVERADSRADALGREVEALRLAARAAEESAFGAQRQLDQERLLHAQLLEGKEAEARAQLDRSALDHESRMRELQEELTRARKVQASLERQLELTKAQLRQGRYGEDDDLMPGGAVATSTHVRWKEDTRGREYRHAAPPIGSLELSLSRLPVAEASADSLDARQSSAGDRIPASYGSHAQDSARKHGSSGAPPDQLAAVRDQVAAAKRYLRQVANAGFRDL